MSTNAHQSSKRIDSTADEHVHDLTLFQIDLLAQIYGNPAMGLEIKRGLESEYRDEFTNGRLYSNLDKLDHKGLIEKGELDRRANEYSITELGKAVLVKRKQFLQEQMGYGGRS